VALERLAEYAGEFQRIGLSATVGNPDEIGRFLCGARPFSVVEVPVASNLDITVRFAGEDFGDQVRTVERCLDAPGSTLVFVNTRVTAEALGHSLYSRGDVVVTRFALAGCPGGRRGTVQARGDPGADRDLLDGAWHRYRAYRARPPVWFPKGGIAPGAAGRPRRPPGRRDVVGHGHRDQRGRRQRGVGDHPEGGRRPDRERRPVRAALRRAGESGLRHGPRVRRRPH